MEEHTHEHPENERIVRKVWGRAQPCKGYGQILTPIVVYLHPEQKAELDWLEKDRKKSANQIIPHLITLEHSKRQTAANRRTRKPKA